jgi:hypothetical protein
LPELTDDAFRTLSIDQPTLNGSGSELFSSTKILFIFLVIQVAFFAIPIFIFILILVRSRHVRYGKLNAFLYGSAC